MSPILGIWASAQQPALNATSFESIATISAPSGIIGGASFTSIPQTYKHLQIRAIARTTFAATTDFIGIKFNTDGTAANYRVHNLFGNGATASAGDNGNQVPARLRQFSGANATSGIFGAIVIDVLDYTNTNKYKTLRALGGVDENGSGDIYFNSGLWMSTSAITQIDISAAAGSPDFAQYSHFALYGIKGA